MTRRARGEGLIRQRTDGRWEARISLGFGPDGRRARKSLFGRTQGEVREKLTKVLRDRDQGLPIARDERLTTGAFLIRWIDESAAPVLRPRTLVSYRQIVADYLVPAIGRITLSKLAPADVQVLLNRTATRRSAQTTRNVHAVLRRALSQAVEWGMVPRNVASLAKPPRVRRVEVRALSPIEATGILHAVHGDRLASVVTFALATGVRQGEALALRWQDVQLDAGTARVRHTLQRLSGRSVELAEPKTDRSRRTLTLPASIVAMLSEHRLRQKEERLRAGVRWRGPDRPDDPAGYVFTTSIGTPMIGSDVTRAFQGLLAAAGLPRMRFHDLRHGAASLLLAQGVSPRVIQDMLGHSTITTTMSVYAHVIPELQRDAAARMDAILSPKGSATG